MAGAALVTGARRGIGRAIALRLARDGARVAVNDLLAGPELEAVADECGGIAVPADVARPGQVGAMVQSVERELGGVEVLVANAAAMAMGPFLEREPDEWWRQLDVNLTGTFALIDAVLPGMREAGSGRIVVVASEWGVIGWPNATGYSASKSGLIALVKSLGRELAREGIVVNGVAPGVIDSPQIHNDAEDAGISLDEMRARYAAATPLRRIGTVEEVAAAVSFLATGEVTSMVGHVLQPNGGTTRSEA